MLTFLKHFSLKFNKKHSCLGSSRVGSLPNETKWHLVLFSLELNETKCHLVLVLPN